MTMTNAEWMIENGIDFFRLFCKKCAMTKSGLYTYDILLDDKKISAIYTDDTSAVNAILAWLDMKHKEQILDDAEKLYLKGVIRPFRDKVLYIAKRGIMDRRKEYIYIHVTDDCICLPCFRKGSMYKGMKLGYEYSLKELGL